jgi:hypothetical protein
LTTWLYAIVVVVVLPALGAAELLVPAWFADLPVFAGGDWRSVRNDAATMLAAGQLTLGGYELIELQIHRPQ